MDDSNAANGCEIIRLRPGQSGLDYSSNTLGGKKIAITYGHREFDSQRKLALHLKISEASVARHTKKGHYKGTKITRVENEKRN